MQDLCIFQEMVGTALAQHTSVITISTKHCFPKQLTDENLQYLQRQNKTVIYTFIHTLQ